MPAPVTTDEFLDLGCKSGVLDRKVVTDFLEKRQQPVPDTPKGLAVILIREGLMTTFQAEHLLAGKWRGFVISGKYRLLQRVGAGGMGTVYLCEHILMRRKVALKVLPVAQAEDPAALDRFYREARAVAALDHPNIVRAYDIDHEIKLHFLVLEYVDGVSLQELVKRRGALSVLRACHYIRQAAYGLQHAHEAGLVHRDIKPGNLLVDRYGVVKLLDMGLARFFHDDRDELTKQYDANSVLGTADYLAPEQAQDSHAVDIRADIYSLGITFYFLVCGQTPFQDGTVSQKLIWHQVRQPKPIRSLKPEVSEEIAAIIDKLIAKDPADRYQTPIELADALEPWTREPIPTPDADDLPRTPGSGPPSSPSQVPRSTVPAARGPLSPTPSKSGAGESRGTIGRPRLEVVTARTAATVAAPPTVKLPAESVDTPPISSQRTVTPGTVRTVPATAAKNDTTAKSTKIQRKAVAKEAGSSKRVAKPQPRDTSRSFWMLVGGAGVGVLLCTAVIVWLAQSPGDSQITSPPKRTNDPSAKKLEHRVGWLRTFPNHEKHVFRVAISPDGRRVVSVSEDKTARVWDLTSGRELLVFSEHTDAIHYAAFSHDGKRVATSSNDRTIRVWEVDTGSEVQVLKGHDKRVWCAVFTPDDKKIFSGSEDTTARLWDVETGEEIRSFTGHTKAVNSVAVSPDGTRAVTGGWDSTLRLWDLESATEVQQIKAHAGNVSTVAFSPDGKLILSGGGDKFARLWDADTLKRIHQFEGHTGAVWIVAFSADGQRALSGGPDKTIRLWDVPGQAIVSTFSGHTDGVTGVAFSPDGRFAVSSSRDATVRVWGLP